LQAQRGERADVESLVRLEQLERLEAQARAIVRRAGAAVAQDAAEGRHPAEAAVGLEHAVAFDAAVHLGAHAELVEQVHLVPARDAPGCHPRVEQLVGPPQQRVERFGSVTLLERAVGKFGEVPGRRRGFEVVAQVQPGVANAHLGHHVERPAAGQGDLQLGERLEAAADPRGGPADALGDRLELADSRRDQRHHAVRLAQVEARQHDRVRGVATGHRHDRTVALAGLGRRALPIGSRLPAKVTADPSRSV
jgi:hypothetical protein